MRAQALVGVVALLLHGCGSPPSPQVDNETQVTVPTVPTPSAPALSAADEDTIKQGLLQQLIRVRIRNLDGTVHSMCTDVFELGEPKIMDVAIQGLSGKVRLEVPVTARTPIRMPISGQTYFPTIGCYGTPPGGWTEGQVAASRYELNIEKWGSGWQLARQQDFRITG